ncbi:MAG: hypothetical protein IPO27_16400 [Bacteroidetes bacterium]|nr:hypothetical protein [Bacteroidota bacterium]
METQFPDGKREERHLYKAFELIETEKVEAMLRQNGIHRETKVIKHDFRNQSAKWWMAAAVILIAAASFFIYVNITLPDPQQLADNSLSTLVADYNSSYRSSGSSQQLSDIQNSINNAQWEVATRQLDAALLKTSNTDSNAIMNIYFYKGIIHLEQHEYKSAILIFTPVANFNNGAFQKDAVWLRALAHTKNNDFAAAKIDLKSTAQYTGWKKADEAVKILHALGDDN